MSVGQIYIRTDGRRPDGKTYVPICGTGNAGLDSGSSDRLASDVAANCWSLAIGNIYNLE